MPKSTKLLSISKTTGEWCLIEKKISESGKINLSQYIHKEAIKIKNAFKDNPTTITCASGKRVEKRPCIFIGVYEELEGIATIMDISVSTLIDRFVIDPLLTPKI